MKVNSWLFSLFKWIEGCIERRLLFWNHDAWLGLEELRHSLIRVRLRLQPLKIIHYGRNTDMFRMCLSVSQPLTSVEGIRSRARHTASPDTRQAFHSAPSRASISFSAKKDHRGGHQLRLYLHRSEKRQRYEEEMFIVQKHLLCTIDGPDSSYSRLDIHMVWNVCRELKIDPPIQTAYLRSGGAMILTFIVVGARAFICFSIRSAIPGYIVVPERNQLAFSLSAPWRISAVN